MKKHNRYLSFFLLFGVMVILVHNIVPHHHHTDPIFSHEDNHCPTSDNERDEEKNAPFHCHAFNNTDWYNQGPKVGNLIYLVALTSDYHIIYHHFPLYGQTLPIYFEWDIVPYYQRNIPKRGPPTC